jgi:hypothetical protein
MNYNPFMARAGTGRSQPVPAIESDAAFLARQSELQSLYRDFRSTIDEFRQLSPDRRYAEEHGDQTAPDSTNSELEFLIGEIESIQTETDQIAALMAQPKFAQNPRARELKHEVHRLQNMHAALRSRAETLLD